MFLKNAELNILNQSFWSRKPAPEMFEVEFDVNVMWIFNVSKQGTSIQNEKSLFILYSWVMLFT